MQSTNLDRRSFLRGRSSKVVPNAIRPPWAIEVSQFIDSCTRCDECIESCPEKILFRGDGGYPEVNFKQGACTFCGKCVEACQAGALLSNEKRVDEAWQLDVNIKTSCLSLNAIMCRICGDNCEEQAIAFKLQLGGVSIPLIDNEQCTGCGECLYVCPENSISIKNA